MPHLLISPSSTSVMLALLCCFSGCSDCAARAPEAGIAQQVPLERGLRPHSEPLPLLDGEIDVENKYSSTVMIKTRVPSGSEMGCNGVLVAPQFVLTAAHCVCMKHESSDSDSEGEGIFDNSACGQSATVRTVTYLPPRRTGAMRYLTEDYEGTIQVHPEFKLIRGKQGDIVSSHADLAVIHLNAPVAEDLPPVALAETEIGIDETITTVGYGYDGPGSTTYEKRRFSKSEIVEFIKPGSERVLLEQPARPLFRNDSGGPCLREAGDGYTLVGISSRGLGNEPTCTSTHAHRAWLLEKIRLVALPRVPSP